MKIDYDEALNCVNTYSRPSELKITDIRTADVVDSPAQTSFIKIYTNQGICGFGEVRDGASKLYALMLKGRLLGENPCNIDYLFRRIKQFGNHSRQAGGVCGIELALWDLAGKAYGVPVYQMLGGKFRDKAPSYYDTPIDTSVYRNGMDFDEVYDGKKAGEEILRHVKDGWAFYKLGNLEGLLYDSGTVSFQTNFYEDMKEARSLPEKLKNGPDRLAYYASRNREYYYADMEPSRKGIRYTEATLDRAEKFVKDIRSVIGNDIQFAFDHVGHMGVKDAIRLARRLEKYNIAWLEDVFPWFRTEQYAKLARATTTPICTGEDFYLKESVEPLLASGGVDIVHPDILSAGGIMETKKIGEMAQKYGVKMAIHMCEGPVAYMAAGHIGVATNNFLAIETIQDLRDWWKDIAVSNPRRIYENGGVTPSEQPGLGIMDLNDEVLREHVDPRYPEIWKPTDEWNEEYSVDRHWC